MAAEPVRAHVVVSGRVQGVFFRASAAEEARALGVSGWVRNVGDDVEAVFEGSRTAVERMIEWSHHGPTHASVEFVDTTWEAPEGLAAFTVR